MHKRYAVPIIVLLLFTALLTACGGSSATDTPKAAAPTTAAPTTVPTTVAPTTAAASAATAATRPAGSATTGSVTAPTVAPTTAGSASAAAVTRPASSAATGSTTAPTTTARAASAVTGTRPAGSATTGSATAGTTTAGSATAGTGLTLFTDPKGRFSFSRPAAWTVGQSTSADSIVQFNSSNPLGVVDISTESVASSITPDKYLEAALTQIKQGIPDAQQIGTTTLQLDTEPAVQIDYTGTVGGNKIYFSQIFALHKGIAYVLTLGTQPADIDKMKQQAIVVVQTWKFLQ